MNTNYEWFNWLQFMFLEYFKEWKVNVKQRQGKRVISTCEFIDMINKWINIMNTNNEWFHWLEFVFLDLKQTARIMEETGMNEFSEINTMEGLRKVESDFYLKQKAFLFNLKNVAEYYAVTEDVAMSRFASFLAPRGLKRELTHQHLLRKEQLRNELAELNLSFAKDLDKTKLGRDAPRP